MHPTHPSHASTVLIGTFPPTECGLATFTRSSATAMSDGRRVGVVELVDSPRGKLASMVCATWTKGDRQSMRRAVDVIHTYDSAIIQHEFGIFGGDDGCEVLDLVRAIDVPVVSVLHTIPERPSANQRRILEELYAESDSVVTLTETARRRLMRTTSVDGERVAVIPHGAHEIAAIEPADDARPIVLTWGLLGPGKGIEHVIDAMAQLIDVDPRLEYWIVGETHPKIFAASGEAYRESLKERADRQGVGDRVTFFDGYRDLAGLQALIAQATVVALPYDSREQVTSGVLVEAIAAGLPVVATDFPHARELLASGCGLVVPHEDPTAIATALRTILTDDEYRAELVANAQRVGPTMFWPEVGRTFGKLIDRCVIERSAEQAESQMASA